MALDKQQKENWLTALRSGDYKQGVRKLRNDYYGTHCCIGVFAVCNGISLDKNGESMLGPKGPVGYSPLGDQIGAEQVNVLWKMNDSQDKSFLEIADYIEQNL